MDVTETVRKHLDNSPALHNRTLEVSESIVRDEIEQTHGDPGDYYRGSIKASAVERFTEELRLIVEENIGLGNPRADVLLHDLVSEALAAVDWATLAEEWVDAALDEADHQGVESLAQV